VKAIVFLSTGRCGTQFVATYLDQAAGDRAVVVHEPIGPRYAPKKTLRAPDLDAVLPDYPAVQRHFKKLEREIEGGDLHVETGWPLCTWVPWFLRRFGDEALVVHLVRDPVPFAHSLASHFFYSPEQPFELVTRMSEFHPTDPGVKHTGYSAIWDQLNPVEKSLFQWLEINTWAEELKAAWEEHFVTFRFEDLMPDPAMLIEGMSERRPELADVFRDRPPSPGVVDQWPQTTRVQVETLRYMPEVAELAARYGYSMDRAPA
jgi:hypothetical protein